MEASVDTPTKHQRPHYKSLYLTAVSLNDRLRAEIQVNNQVLTESSNANSQARAALLAVSTRLRSWRLVAVPLIAYALIDVVLHIVFR